MIDMNRDNLGLMIEAGYIFLGMQRFKEAREVFEGVCVLVPDSDVPLIALGSVDFCERKFAQAQRRYKKALKINPDSIFAEAYIGEALFFMGKQAEAIKQLKDVSKKDPKGAAGDFVRALLDAIDKGYTPPMLSGHEEVREYVKAKKEHQK